MCWCYRRLLRISWTQHKTNEWILRELEVERELLGRVKSLKLGYYGHTTRKYESLEKQLIQGCTPGNRSRGRQYGCAEPDENVGYRFSKN